MDLVVAPDRANRIHDAVPLWSGPSVQSDANTYIEAVQDFRTDDPLRGAVSNPMPTGVINDSNEKFLSSEGELKK